MPQVFHTAGMARRSKDKGRRSRTEILQASTSTVPDFKLVFRPSTELRAGIVGSHADGGNPVKFPAGRYQSNVVVVEDAQSGEQMDVVWSQAEAHKAVAFIRNKRQPKVAPEQKVR